MQRAAIHPLLLLLGLVVLAVPSCTSVQSLVESGNYEKTIAVAQRRLTGKQKKNPKYVAALETAVNRANEEDVNRAEFLKKKPEVDWVRVHAIYDNLKQRQDALRPLLPLTDKNGRKANFRFVKVEGPLAEATNRAADQVYRQALSELEAGRRGDKSAARAAYSSFERTDRYRSNYRDSYTLQAEAEQLGKVYVTVDVVNQSGGYLPRGFEDELLRLRTDNMDDRWRVFDFHRRDDRSYDYSARIVIRDIAVSPERISERSYVDEKQIIDGEEYVLDSRGNVAKDSLGNDITRPRKVIVRAEILEVLQQKSAFVTGSMQLYDLRRQRVVDEEELSAEAVFEHYASTYRGDPRALSGDSRRRIGNQPRQFPTNESLILDAVAVLKPHLQNRLADSHRLI
ncbi:hypothetical protein GGR28_000708 [Lewinella aquimaris]|uniref:Uncharacterized protein n=1 Tax=Neolewinella aquimaris TaxID=1835722 RepID=A0A840E4R4_9BACT|nr:hypothetical protein [Neolewinella aquimaris]MBB4078107.1 hypothetical protein [Neolewinella aquimaris]